MPAITESDVETSVADAPQFISYYHPRDFIRATRMDRYSEMMLERLGVAVMIGRAERGPETVAAIGRNGAAYLVAVGGAAFLVSQAIRAARVLAFEDLGMEAIHEFEVEDMPVTVAVDARGSSVHVDGPRRWRMPAATGARS